MTDCGAASGDAKGVADGLLQLLGLQGFGGPSVRGPYPAQQRRSDLRTVVVGAERRDRSLPASLSEVLIVVVQLLAGSLKKLLNLRSGTSSDRCYDRRAEAILGEA